MDIGDCMYRNILEQYLSDKRIQHSIAVSEQAVYLANIHGACIKQAQIAGYLHDICKEMSVEEQNIIILKYGVGEDESIVSIKAVLHSISGSLFVKYQLGIINDDILNAIRYHTTARKNMSLLEKIIVLADRTSNDRFYPNVDYLRELSKVDLDIAVLVAMQNQIQQSILKGQILLKDTVEAYNSLLIACNKK